MSILNLLMKILKYPEVPELQDPCGFTVPCMNRIVVLVYPVVNKPELLTHEPDFWLPGPVYPFQHGEVEPCLMAGFPALCDGDSRDGEDLPGKEQPATPRAPVSPREDGPRVRCRVFSILVF